MHKSGTKDIQYTGVLTILLALVICFGLVNGMTSVGVPTASSETEAVDKYTAEIIDEEHTILEDSYVDVTDHGAVGDGVTDDYHSIMDAIDHAVDNNEDGVYFPSGVFAIGNKIRMNSEQNGLTFLSDEDAVIKAIDSDATRIFEIKGDTAGDVEDITIKGLELDGNKDDLNIDRWGNWGIHVWSDDSTVRNLHIEDIHAHDFTGNGLYIDSSDTVVKNILSNYNWGHGFATGTRANNVLFENITSHDNFSPDNPIVGSGFDIHGGHDIVIDDFEIRNNGYGMKTSLGQPTATVRNGVINDNNGCGYRTTGEPATYMYFENVEVSGNGASGMEFRYDGGEIIMNDVSILNNGQDPDLNENGALFIYGEYERFDLEDLTVEDHPGIGINSYTSGLTIERLDISGCDGASIYPRPAPAVIEPTDLQDSYYTVDQPLYLDPFEVHDDGIVIDEEKFRALPENGDVEVNLDDWSLDERIFTAHASDTVLFELEGLEPYTSYSIYQGGSLKEYVSTDSDGSLGFENDDWSSQEFRIEEGGVNVVTQEPRDITNNSAIFQGEVTDMDGQSELEVFFRYREEEEQEWIETGYQTMTSPAEYDESVTGLAPGTGYEYKAVAQWDDGEMTGEVISFSTGFETDPYDWQGFLDPDDNDVIYRSEFPMDLTTIVDSVPESDDDDGGTTLDYWGEFYIDGQHDGEKALNTEPDHTEYVFESLDEGTYVLTVEWHYDLGLIETDEITVTLQEGESSFELSDLQVDPEEMYVGTEMLVEVDVENVGTETGDHTAEFYKDSELIGTDTVNVDPGQSKTAQIVHTVVDAGSYEVSVEALTQDITVYSYPNVESGSATNVTENSAELHGEVTDIGMEDAVTAYFMYRKTGSSAWTETTQQTIIGEEKFYSTIDDLSSKTEYEFISMIEWDGGDDEGETLTFTTEEEFPEIETIKATNITENSAVLVGELTSIGDSNEVTVFFRLREEGQEAWVESDEPQSMTDEGIFDESWSNLAPSTVYEFEAVLEYNDDVVTGDTAAFSTGLRVRTGTASDITIDSAVLHGELLGLGENDQVDVYFEYKKEDEIEWSKTGPETMEDTGGFAKEIIELEIDTPYEFRALVEGDEKDVGEIVSFTTKSIRPVITDLSPAEGEVVKGEELVISAKMEHPLDYDLEMAKVDLIDEWPPLDADIDGDVASVKIPFSLSSGEHTYEFYMEDEEGNHNSTTVTFYVDNTLPYLTIEIKNDVTDDDFEIIGDTEPGIRVFLNGEMIDVSEDGHFEYRATLSEGENLFELIAADEAGNRVERVFTGLYLPQLSDLEEDIEDLKDTIAHVKDVIDEIDDITEDLEMDIEEVKENLSAELDDLEYALDENITLLEECLDERRADQLEIVHENITEIKEELTELEKSVENIHKEVEQEEEERSDYGLLHTGLVLLVIVVGIVLSSVLVLHSKSEDGELSKDWSEEEQEDGYGDELENVSEDEADML